MLTYLMYRYCYLRVAYLVLFALRLVGGWLGGVVVSALDLRPRGPGFNSRPVHRQAATLGKLLTPMCLCHQAVVQYNLVPAKGR